jgi:hypothetical protein
VCLCFHNLGKPDLFIGSADLMTRNLDHRIEVVLPILDDKIKKQLLQILELQWKDNVKAGFLMKHNLIYLRTKLQLKKLSEARMRFMISGKICEEEVILFWLSEIIGFLMQIFGLKKNIVKSVTMIDKTAPQYKETISFPSGIQVVGIPKLLYL